MCVFVVQSLSHVWLLATPWAAARQASLSFIISPSSLKFMSIELVIKSSHLILCHPLLLLPSVFPSINVFSSELALCIRWPKYWSCSFSISPSNEYLGSFPLELTGLISLQSKGLSRVLWSLNHWTTREVPLDSIVNSTTFAVTSSAKVLNPWNYSWRLESILSKILLHWYFDLFPWIADVNNGI